MTNSNNNNCTLITTEELIACKMLADGKTSLQIKDVFLYAKQIESKIKNQKINATILLNITYLNDFLRNYKSLFIAKRDKILLINKDSLEFVYTHIVREMPYEKQKLLEIHQIANRYKKIYPPEEQQ